MVPVRKVVDRVAVEDGEGEDGKSGQYLITTHSSRPASRRTPRRNKLDLPAGFIHVRTFTPGFNPVEEQLPVGAELPREVVLTRTAPLPDSTHQLSGMVPVPGSSNTFFTHAKVEILDGPLAGVFTFTDDDMGEFFLRSLPPGMMRVRASFGSMSEIASVDISAPNTWLTFHVGQQ